MLFFYHAFDAVGAKVMAAGHLLGLDQNTKANWAAHLNMEVPLLFRFFLLGRS